MIAYVLASCVPGTEKEIVTKIKSLPGITEVNGVMGRYDIFVKISADSPTKIDSAIGKIRSIESISSTLTMSVIYGQGGTIDDER